MYQNWQFVNIDKRHTSGYLGKLGGLFFSSITEELIYTLTIPAGPLQPALSNSPFQEVASIWAGDRIICLGDYATSWPQNILDAVDFLPKSSDQTSHDPTQMSPEAFTASCKLIIDVDFGPDMLVAFPRDRVWALRNISKKLYVRSDRVPTINGEKNLEYESHHGLQSFPGLGQVVLANILWSDDSSTSMRFSDVQGGWAGDRIDIRLMDDVAEEMQEQGWKDISRQEVIKIYDIFFEEGNVEGELPEEPQASFNS
ncbi:hypothetical protein M413DRAFT_448941 [Hebeloma cylindrosporum]|uniref:Uncharacterized protein n=1 Tax=Hebeloma cylindrosporum TaxID=76867 RepID=A0A0C2XFX6_HEBCY|nr:hypothetical protein M413DRAFT_448941 [Hebeloma cylindrosporum h7]